MKRTFGKELNTVYDVIALSESIAELPASEITGFYIIPVADIISSNYIARKLCDDQDFSALVDSINQKGIIQPLLVKKNNYKYQIIAGERRFAAAKKLELTEVPVIVCEVDDRLCLIYSLLENLQRKGLNPIEQANAFWRLQQEYKLTHAEIAEQISYSRSTVTNILRLLSLPESIKSMLEASILELGHARSLIGLDYKTQEKLAKKIVKQELTVRETEKLVNKVKQGNSVDIADVKNSFASSHTESSLKSNYYSEHLSHKFHTNVTVSLDEDYKGKIIINIDSEEQLISILDLIK